VAVVTGPSAPRSGGGTPAGDGHYFSPVPGTASRPGAVRLTLPDLTVDLSTDAGVFSPGRVDPGTKLLLTEVPDPADWPDGPVVDLGAGYGPIAITAALRAPDREVWAVEVNERARGLCRSNAAAAGVTDRVRVAAPADVPDDLRVSMVLSNPPIRIGKGALHELLTTWLGRLTDGGTAWLVVQKHLGADSLTRWLIEQGHEVERTRSRQGYRVLRVAPPT
jgi:16S rRNA (guanine1207-N2)-methyltransferase